MVSCLVQVIIFVKSVQRCIALSQLLVEQNFPAICIHRGMPQEERFVGGSDFGVLLLKSFFCQAGQVPGL